MATTTISPGANIQDVIDSAASGTTVVFTAGTYNVSDVINLKSGVSLEGQPGATLLSNGTTGIFQGQGVQNVTISGFTLDGHNGGPGDTSGAIYLDGDGSTPGNNIHILNNTFQNWTNSNAMTLWSTQNTYIEGNTIKNGYQGITWDTTSGTPPLNNLVISGNSITGMSRMGIETGFSSTISNIHIDNNTLSNIKDMSISFVEGDTSGNFTSGTVLGNHIDGSGNSGNVPLLEVGNRGGTDNITVAQNVLSNSEWGMSIGDVRGMGVLNNTFTNVQNPYSVDGGYAGTEWIGSNTIDGARVNGWSDHGAYGAQPTLYSASTLLPGVNPVGTAATAAQSSTTTASTSDPQATTTASASDPQATTAAGTSDPQATTAASTSDPLATTTASTSDPLATTAAGTSDPLATTTSSTSTSPATTTTSTSDPLATTTTSTSTSPATTATSTSDPLATTTSSTSTSPTTTTTSASDPLTAPVQQSTVLPSLGSTGGFVQGTTSTSQSSAGSSVTSGTQSSADSGTLAQQAGGQLTTDLTHFGWFGKALAGGGWLAGTGTQTQTASGIGAAFSSLDQSSKPQDLLNVDTWRHS